MKTTIFSYPNMILLLAITATIILTSCDKRIRKQGSGQITSQTRELVNFTDVDADGSYHLYIHVADQPKVVITTDDNIQADVQTFVHDGKLFIEMNDDYHNYHFTKLDIHVYTSSYNRFDLNGSIDAACIDTIQTSSFTSNHNGSGKVTLLFEGNSLEMNTRGSADMSVSGSGTEAKYTINGSGKIDALSATFDEIDANINGSGDMYVRCMVSLDATIDGSGSIRYTGSPVVTTHISGSGNVMPY